MARDPRRVGRSSAAASVWCDHFIKSLGACLRRVRQQKRLTQAQLARLVHIDRTYLGAIERGTANATLSILWAIAAVLQLSFSQLVSDAERDVADPVGKAP